MASMRDIKRRKSSIASTQQITKAMKLVATVKLQQARTRAEQTDPYFRFMYKTVQSLLASSGNVDHPYLKQQDNPKKAIIVISSNRGLAGGYNSNITKLVMNSGIAKEDVEVVSIGHKGRDLLSARGYHIRSDYSDVIERPAYEDAMEISKDLLTAYVAGEIGEIDLVYTHFKNTVVHEPQMMRLLPMDRDAELNTDEEEKLPDDLLMNFEPSEEEALEQIIPKYVTSLLYGAMVESVASENGARMTAMDSATDNAEEMIEELTLKYNQARQSSITQELTEIVAGANALA